MECLELAEAELVVTDLFLEQDSGIKLVATTRRRWPMTTLVLVSGSLKPDHAMDAVRAGADDAVGKDVPPAEILARLRRTDDHANRTYPLPAPPITLHALERKHIDDTLARTGGNVSAAAKILKIHTTSLRRKMKKNR